MKKEWRNEKIEREAVRNGLAVSDLKNAVNAVVCSRKGDTFQAQGWERGIVDEHHGLWFVAHEIVDFMEEQGGVGTV